MIHERLQFDPERFPDTILDSIYDGVTVFTRGPGLAAHQRAVEAVRDEMPGVGAEVTAIDPTVATRFGHWTVLHIMNAVDLAA